MDNPPDALNSTPGIQDPRGQELCRGVWLRQESTESDITVLTVERATSGKDLDIVLAKLGDMVSSLSEEERLRLVVDTTKGFHLENVFAALGSAIAMTFSMGAFKRIDMVAVVQDGTVSTLMNNLSKFPMFPITVKGVVTSFEEAMPLFNK